VIDIPGAIIALLDHHQKRLRCGSAVAGRIDRYACRDAAIAQPFDVTDRQDRNA
jgi:hypothetical protein